jgi:hypothetical protein
MNEPRVTFSDGDFWYRQTFRFYDDRIECDWDALFQKGRKIHPVSEISGKFGETTTFGYRLKPTLRTLAVYLIVGLAFHLGFNHPLLHWIGYFFYLSSGLCVVMAIAKLKKDTWIYVLTADGRDLFGVREKKLKGISRDEFVREVQRYTRPANKSPEATPGQRPPSAPSLSSGAPQL